MVPGLLLASAISSCTFVAGTLLFTATAIGMLVAMETPTNAQGVAVGLRARHGVGAQHATRAALVFHQHGLAQADAQFLRDQPAQDG
ncbi:hypothetical protein G6F40_017785 [Rhizopus arrhizus]|nr:hypothetical protein G6F40_017785 [Rhizopus arrhizus]